MAPPVVATSKSPDKEAVNALFGAYFALEAYKKALETHQKEVIGAPSNIRDEISQISKMLSENYELRFAITEAARVASRQGKSASEIDLTVKALTTKNGQAGKSLAEWKKLGEEQEKLWNGRAARLRARTEVERANVLGSPFLPLASGLEAGTIAATCVGSYAMGALGAYISSRSSGRAASMDELHQAGKEGCETGMGLLGLKSLIGPATKIAGRLGTLNPPKMALAGHDDGWEIPKVKMAKRGSMPTRLHKEDVGAKADDALSTFRGGAAEVASEPVVHVYSRTTNVRIEVRLHGQGGLRVELTGASTGRRITASTKNGDIDLQAQATPEQVRDFLQKRGYQVPERELQKLIDHPDYVAPGSPLARQNAATAARTEAKRALTRTSEFTMVGVTEDGTIYVRRTSQNTFDVIVEREAGNNTRLADARQMIVEASYGRYFGAEQLRQVLSGLRVYPKVQ